MANKGINFIRYKAFFGIFMLLLMGHPENCHAQLFGTEGSALKEGFVLPADKPVRILLFRPDVQVAEQTTGRP
ncbi:MAG: hypothetical protein HC843_14255 [Sphingomonadales bacterium]|nr:hypothetical protein [Sphingomonadales bacterium]